MLKGFGDRFDRRRLFRCPLALDREDLEDSILLDILKKTISTFSKHFNLWDSTRNEDNRLLRIAPVV